MIMGALRLCKAVRASKHAFTVEMEHFDGEERRLITRTVGFDNRNDADLFAASCGSIGNFTDIKQYDEGYAIPPPDEGLQFPNMKTRWRLLCTSASV